MRLMSFLQQMLNKEDVYQKLLFSKKVNEKTYDGCRYSKHSSKDIYNIILSKYRIIFANDSIRVGSLLKSEIKSMRLDDLLEYDYFDDGRNFYYEFKNTDYNKTVLTKLLIENEFGYDIRKLGYDILIYDEYILYPDPYGEILMIKADVDEHNTNVLLYPYGYIKYDEKNKRYVFIAQGPGEEIIRTIQEDLEEELGNTLIFSEGNIRMISRVIFSILRKQGIEKGKHVILNMDTKKPCIYEEIAKEK